MVYTDKFTQAILTISALWSMMKNMSTFYFINYLNTVV